MTFKDVVLKHIYYLGCFVLGFLGGFWFVYLLDSMGWF